MASTAVGGDVADASDALRAHHRMMREIIVTTLASAKVSPRPEDYDLVSRVFAKAGGSWERVFRGSVRDVQLLKSVLRVAAKKGYLTKDPEWGS